MNILTNKIVKASVVDLPAVMETFMDCTAEMRKYGIDQWNYQYPEPTQVLNDIRSGNLYVIKNSNRVLATVTLDQNQDKQYQKIDWIHKTKKVLVMHRLGVHPTVQGMGYGKRLCLFAEDHARRLKLEVIRLDAYSENPASNNLYLSLGYEIAPGVCYYNDVKKPFYCYEKDIVL